MATIVLKPGMSIQAAIDANPAGTTFLLEAGVYRGAQFTPKDGQSFIGSAGTVLNGAVEVNGWQSSGSYWKASGLPAPLQPAGIGANGSTLPTLREDLFVNDTLYKRVGSLAEVKDGTWYYDQGSRTAYLSKSPAGAKVEMSSTAQAIRGEADNVTLKNITVEKYASAAQTGAIDIDGDNWSVEHVTARFNHGVGLVMGRGTTVTGGHYNDNGQVGIGAWKADGAKVTGVEAARNNYAGFDTFWDAGGLKITESTGVTVKDSYIHHNNGVGLWFDIDMKNVLVENNTIALNKQVGLAYEISWDAVIRNNDFIRNGTPEPGQPGNWLVGAQLGIQNSTNIQVYGNTMEAANGAGGIALLHENRGGSTYGTWTTKNITITDNEITYLGNNILSGFQVNYQQSQSHGWNIVWNNNDWIVPDGSKQLWMFDSSLREWASARTIPGFEANGHLIVEASQPGAVAPPTGYDPGHGATTPTVPTTPTTPTTPPPSPPAGPDTIVVRAAAQSWNGDPSFKLMVDGVAVGSAATVTTQKAAGWQDITFKLDLPDNAAKIGVNFFNDAYGGAGKDRNLYVDSVTVNGSKLTLDKTALTSNGTASAGLPSSGPDTVTVRVSGDLYKGNAGFKLVADGHELTGPAYTSTAKGTGWQDVTVKVDLPDGAKSLGVTFINNLYESASQDRNLYVDSVTVNGTKLAVDKSGLMKTGDTATATLGSTSGGGTGGGTGTGGTGGDVVVIKAAGDAYKGDPGFKLLADGTLVGGPTYVSADHGDGWQEFVYRLNLPDSTKTLGVDFFNDFSEGPGLDRNLHLHSVSVNGHELLDHDQTMTHNGMVGFYVSSLV